MSAIIYFKNGEALAFDKIILPKDYISILNNDKFIEIVIPIDNTYKKRDLILSCLDIDRIDILHIQKIEKEKSPADKCREELVNLSFVGSIVFEDKIFKNKPTFKIELLRSEMRNPENCHHQMHSVIGKYTEHFDFQVSETNDIDESLCNYTKRNI